MAAFGMLNWIYYDDKIFMQEFLKWVGNDLEK